jgi:hypothetical protein
MSDFVAFLNPNASFVWSLVWILKPSRMLLPCFAITRCFERNRLSCRTDCHQARQMNRAGQGHPDPGRGQKVLYSLTEETPRPVVENSSCERVVPVVLPTGLS